MQTCALGQADFRSGKHSIPEAPGRWISSRITSGRAGGRVLRASSAVAQAPTQRNSGDCLIRKAIPSRTSSSSSTTATLIGVIIVSLTLGHDGIKSHKDMNASHQGGFKAQGRGGDGL